MISVRSWLEEAAIAGHVGARFTLAHYEKINEKMRRANCKHFKRSDASHHRLAIATNLGCDYSMKALPLQLQQCYENGDREVCEDQFTAACQAHEAAVDEMKSPKRVEQAN